MRSIAARARVYGVVGHECPMLCAPHTSYDFTRAAANLMPDFLVRFAIRTLLG
jgi:hypothetical protein